MVRLRSLVIALVAMLVLLLVVGGAYALTQIADRDTVSQSGLGESAKMLSGERLEAAVRHATHGETINQGEKALPAFAALGTVNGATGNRDRNMSRQEFLGMSGLGAAALLLSVAGSSRRRASAASSDYPFSLGAASGDPLPSSVVLWTRLAPDPLNGGGMAQRNVKVRWEIASDENFTDIVQTGKAIAKPERAHSVHVEVEGLQPGRYYWYRFKARNEISPTGRTKTAPALGSRVDAMAFAFASCQNWEAGYYPAYRAMAEEELDLVFHLGDYIYEWAPMKGGVRQHYGEGELKTLTDYRNRHALYKTDPDLQAAHAAHPWVVTWDDHEGWNNYADLREDDRRKAARRALRAVFQAYYEHMPLRSFSNPRSPDQRLYRQIPYGDLAEFSVLDTRTYRTFPDSYGAAPRDANARDEETTMTGPDQERWLLRKLDSSGARWNVIAQQMMMAQLNQEPDSGKAFNLEAWDGYVAQRKRLLDYLSKRRTSNPIVLSGDMHSSWVADLKSDFRDPSSETVATEFVGTSISSGCDASDAEAYKEILGKNPHIRYFDARNGGYVRCNLTPGLWHSDLRIADSVCERRSAVRTVTSFVVEDGRPGVQGRTA
jgi:alkaline phosphatase D